jgi:tRNA threonylcarbamoyladenosine biosynthesis protein TsaE
MRKLFISEKLEDTIELGRKLGSKLKGGEMIELVSDLGGGKTSLTTGLVEGAGSLDLVASPSFTISYLYSTPEFNIHHFDFYRLDDPGIVKLSLAEVVSEKQDVIIVEWGDIVADALPQRRIIIRIKTVANEEDRRLIEVETDQKFNYLVEDLT